jgi:hypothetical protein
MAYERRAKGLNMPSETACTKEQRLPYTTTYTRSYTEGCIGYGWYILIAKMATEGVAVDIYPRRLISSAQTCVGVEDEE